MVCPCRKDLFEMVLYALHNFVSHLAPTGPPLNVSSKVLNSTAAYVEWLPPKASEQNGIIQKYIVSVYEEFNDDELSDIDVVGMTSVTISDLHPYYNYQVTVSAFTILIGPNSAVSFKTEEDGKA